MTCFELWNRGLFPYSYYLFRRFSFENYSLKESPSPVDMTFVSYPSCITTNTGYSETGFHAKSDLTYGGGSPSGYDFYKQQSPKLTAKESLTSSRSIGQRSTARPLLGCSGGYVTSSYISPSFCATKGLLESSDFASTEIPLLERKGRRISGSSDDVSPKKTKQSPSDARHSSALCNDLKPFPSNAADIKVTNPFSSNPAAAAAKPSAKSVEPVKPEFARPPMSYVAMIRQAILQAPGEKLLLQGIYKYIIDTFPFFASKEGWKNSVRHNLSLNKCFERDPSSGERKGGYWKFNHDYDDMFDGSNFRRRRRMRRPRDSSTSSAASSSSFAPAAAAAFPPRPYSYLSPNEFLAAEYGRGYPQLRYPPCQRMQTFHYVQQPPQMMEQQPFPISLPTPAHGYVAPSAAFPGHYPTHCLRESASSSQNHRYPPY